MDGLTWLFQSYKCFLLQNLILTMMFLGNFQCVTGIFHLKGDFYLVLGIWQNVYWNHNNIMKKRRVNFLKKN